MNSNSSDSSLTSVTNVGILFYLATAGVDCGLGLIINSWSLWVIVAGGWGLIEAEVLTVNTVILELVYNFSFTLMLYTFSYNLYTNTAVSLVLLFVHGTTFIARPLLLCCMCVERYVAVVHPVVFLRYKPLRYKLRVLAVVWVLILTGAVVNFVLNEDSEMRLILLLALYLGVLVVSLISSVFIIHVLKRPRPGDGGNRKKAEGGCSQHKKTLRILSLMVMMMIVNYVPLVIAFATKKLFSDQNFNTCVFPIVISLGLTGSPLQGFLFLHRMGKLPCSLHGPNGRMLLTLPGWSLVILIGVALGPVVQVGSLQMLSQRVSQAVTLEFVS
ncbi:hypothetical protein PAMP_020373 [Pampus punctatissimus]